MKKFIKGFICFIVILALSGCITNNNINSSKKDKLEEFVSSLKESTDTEDLSDSTYETDIIARDNSLVYVYTYKTTYNTEMVKLLKTYLEEVIKNQSSTFNTVLDSVRGVVPDTKSVIVEYYNGDNTLITSIEFK